MSRRWAAIGILLLLPLSGGCQSAPTFESWKASVEEYIAAEGNGDPNCLRDLTLASTDRGFAELGDPKASEPSDVNGLLLGHRSIAGSPWFVFLVATVHGRQVQDMRLAVLGARDGQLIWRTSSDNAPALAAYREPGQRSTQSAVVMSTASRQAFPAQGDRFLLDIDGPRITATHPASKAQWTLTLSEESLAATP